jgi:glycosyltransferase involved in cell wall biosynthesis
MILEPCSLQHRDRLTRMRCVSSVHSRIRILLLTNVVRADCGVWTALAHAANTLDGNVFDIWVASLSADGPLREKLVIPRDRIVSFGVGARARPAQAVRALTSFIACNGIQVVHAHGFPANVLGWLAARAAGVEATVSTEHSVLCPEKTEAERVLESAVAVRTSRLVAVSEAVRDARACQLGISSNHFIVIPNSVPVAKLPQFPGDLTARKRKEFGIATDDVVVIMVGRMAPEKAHAALIGESRAVLDRAGGVTFLFVGDGSLAAPLQRLAERLGLGRRVRFLGVRSDVYELFEISDVFALPSLWEGLPVALLEAGAFGLPAVATDVGGIGEVIVDGRNGFLVGPGDQRALGERVGELVADPALRAKMGHAAKARICSSFDSEQVVPKLAALYQKLVLS